MNRYSLLLLLLFANSCRIIKPFAATKPSENRITGAAFYQQVASWKWKERDSLATHEILAGNIPSHLRRFVPITNAIVDSNGHTIKAVLYVSSDYLAIGKDDDWARIPLTPMAAQLIADRFHCFLPTRKIVDLIYEQAACKLVPVPMYAFRDSSVTMWQHHLIVEGLRKNRRGLIAGIKKDVVLSGKILVDNRPNRVAIYGWHQLNGQPIQPLYTGHVNWWVDYSHGIRLIYRTIWINGKPRDYTEVLSHPQWKKLICDETNCDFTHY